MIAQSVAEIVKGHVRLTVEGIDRMYLNVYVPGLQYERGINRFGWRKRPATRTPVVFPVVSITLRPFNPASFRLFRLVRQSPDLYKAFDLLVNFWSERRDLNSGPPVPQTGALTGLRYAPNGGDYSDWGRAVQPTVADTRLQAAEPRLLVETFRLAH